MRRSYLENIEILLKIGWSTQLCFSAKIFSVKKL